jgi:hypothetical protein
MKLKSSTCKIGKKLRKKVQHLGAKELKNKHSFLQLGN